VAGAAGYEIVRLRLMGGDHARRLQVMAETPEGEMNVEDCARLSRALSEVLDAADPLSGEYTLEASTPGSIAPDPAEGLRGLRRSRGADRTGPHGGGPQAFRGELAGVEGDQVAINLEGGRDRLVPFAWITEAKLILTDRLMERVAEERARRLAGGSHPDSDQEDVP
jgi:ribosome maturation factor RimP